MFSKPKKQQTTSSRRPQVPQQKMRSNAVFSYHASRSARETNLYRDSAREQDLATPRHTKRIKWVTRMPTLAGCLAGVVLLGFFLQLRPQVAVSTVGDSQGQLFLRDKSVYQQAAQEAFQPWLNGNKITVNANKITADMKRQFPELRVVSVVLPIFGNQPTVFIQPATPKLLLVSKDGMYVLDANGRALIAGNQVAKLSELGVPVVNDESSLAVDTGSLALPRGTVSFITEVVGQLKAKGITVTSLALPAGTNELHARFEKVKYRVMFNLHGDAREEAGAYLAVKQHLEASKKVPAEYVDVRVENKAYYK